MTAPAPRHNPIARLAEGYWAESCRPLASLVFIAPLLLIYEVSAITLSRFDIQIQGSVDHWMRWLLDLMGFGQHFVLPFLTICILLAWQYLSRQPWRMSRGVYWGMVGECLLLASCLRIFSPLLRSIFPALRLSGGDKLGNAVGHFGVGIYEELLFRLILLMVVAWLIRRAGGKPRASMAVAVLLTSVAFSAAHFGPDGYSFTWLTFSFLFLAGAFFAVLFIFRGFGIAAGTHAAYNILVEIL